MHIYEYKERDIEDVLNAVRDRLNELAHQNPDSFKIILDYDGYSLLIHTETKNKRLIV